MKLGEKLSAYIKNYAVKYSVTAALFFGALLAFLNLSIETLGVVSKLANKNLIILICSVVLIAVAIIWAVLRIKRNKISLFDFLIQIAISSLLIFVIVGKTMINMADLVFYTSLGVLAVLIILLVIRVLTFRVDEGTNEILLSKSNFSFKGYFAQFFRKFDFFALLVVLATVVLLVMLASNYKFFENLADSTSMIRSLVYITGALSALGLILALPAKIKYKSMNIVDLTAFLLDIVVIALTISAYNHIKWYILMVMWAVAISLTAVCMVSTNCPTETQRRAKEAADELEENNEKAVLDYSTEVAVDLVEDEPTEVIYEVEDNEYTQIINEVNYELNQVNVDIEQLIKNVNEELCPSEVVAEEVECVEQEIEEVEEPEEQGDEQSDEDIFEIELDCEEYEQRLDRMESDIAQILEILKNLKAVPVQSEPIEEVVEEVEETVEPTEEVVDEIVEPIEEVVEETAEPIADETTVDEPIEETEEVEESGEQEVDESGEQDEESVEEIDDTDGELSFEFSDQQENLIAVKSHLSFEMKLRKASDEVKAFYNTIKNELCSYGIKARMSKNRENFNKGRFKIARMAINGKTLKLYMSADPLQLDSSYYHHQDVSDKKSVAHLPTMMNIRSKLAVRKACEIIASICEDNVIKKKKRYVPQNYVEGMTLDGFTTFEIKGLDYLIPENGVVSKEYAEQYDAKFATDCLDYVMQEEAPKKIICAELSLDDLANEFADGDRISLDNLRGKMGVQVNADYLKITESAELSKKLIIVANEFTQTAAKMICLAGGQAIAVKFKS